ncbi:MAG: c-type cytochrome [Meiothermus sp.]|uniref:c-type cytochrome n=1 Tax=Meiothermus sp. TaxID=1955249 RepID=UPI0025CD1B91|nr:c-type cytochrome [Meiothermus sp.]MCS7068653.1 c-type cytochrome [Meiothermus sp.]MCX7600750.1 c-type cytochrome [Meiothermus sp.]
MPKRLLLLVCLALGLIGAGPAQPPTYHGEVAEILQANCAGCHTEGGIAPFPLDDARWARNMAAAIADSVKQGRMPPWPPGEGTPPLKDERKLSPRAKAALIAWAEAGAPLGDPRPINVKASAPSPKPDLVATLNPPYTPDDALQDDYRCFLMPATFEQDTFVTGYKIIPGDKRSVHHVILFLIGPDMVGAAEAKDRAEPGPGWKCFGGPGLSSDPRNIGGILGFWVPGGGATLLPEGTGRFLRAGSRVVMQVHYNTASGANPDATQMALYLAPKGVQLKRLVGMTLAAPVEIRCPPGLTGETCTREYARARTELGFIADWIHLLCNTSIEDYARRNIGDGSRQATSCDWTAQSALEVYGVTAHMHLRGVEFRVEVNPGTAGARTLLNIPQWNFQWQGEYWYQTPLRLRQGDKVRVTCVYDNKSAIPGPGGEPLPPRYMTWGEGTTDEMCLGSLFGVRE